MCRGKDVCAAAVAAPALGRLRTRARNERLHVRKVGAGNTTKQGAILRLLVCKQIADDFNARRRKIAKKKAVAAKSSGAV